MIQPIEDHQINRSKIIHVFPPNFSKHSSSNFLNTFVLNLFNEAEQEFLNALFFKIIVERFKNNVSFSVLNSILCGSLDCFNILPNQPVSSSLIDAIKKFTNSESLQEKFIDKLGYFIKPEPMMLNEIEIGSRINLIQLSTLVLSNPSILNEIEAEENLIGDAFDDSIFNSVLTCNSKRRQALLFKLRVEFGVDDISIIKRGKNRKYCMVYSIFANVPPEQRLKKKNVYLIAIVNREALKKARGTINDILRPAFASLQSMSTDGINVHIRRKDSSTQTINIKAVLLAVCGDNLGIYEILGLKLSWSKGFICRYCLAAHNQIQEYTKKRPLAGSDHDVEEYNKLVNNLVPKQANRFNVTNSCLFATLPGFNVWNLAPPDITHDLAEGVIARALGNVILKNCVMLSLAETMKVINNFPFYNSKITVRLEGECFVFVGTKAIQVSKIQCKLLKLSIVFYFRN